MRLAVLASLALGCGATLLLSELRWFRRASLTERLRLYTAADLPTRARKRTGGSFRDVVEPIAREVGARIATVFGVDEDVATRLERIHAEVDATAFRMRQMAWAAAAFGVGALLATAARVPPAVALVFVAGLPLLAFLVLEQQLAGASARWQRTVLLELPVLAEQLGMLLNAGYSLGGALNRVAARGKGCTSADLRLVTTRLRQGLDEVEALREWADRARVDALDRLTAVLALNREAGDLGRLVSDEARAIRREVHRQLVEAVERRAQTVWIPVTVATLVPGVLFLAVPFIEAMRLFTA
jgi:tight adherence protein C